MELVYFACIWMLASFVKSISGMGSGMFAAPCMLLFMDIQLVVPVICTLSILQSVGLAIQYRKEFHLNDILFVLICAIPGICMGTYALKVLSSHVLEIFMALFLICYAIWSLMHTQRVKARKNTVMAGACGFFSGFFGSTTAFAGPPLAIYVLYAGWKSEKVLGFLGCAFVLINAITCVSQYFAGLYTKEILGYLLVGVPACGVGMCLATPFIKYISQNVFRKIILLLIGFAGLISLLRVISHYF